MLKELKSYSRMEGGDKNNHSLIDRLGVAITKIERTTP